MVSPLSLPVLDPNITSNTKAAEDHYTADYPEDEVDSDDEFDRNAYNYRNRNASDNEEWDEDDEVAFSDGEDTDPWKGQPVWMRPTKVPKIGSDSDED